MTQMAKIHKLAFPVFAKKDFVYLDSGATAQKPQVVIDAVASYEVEECANIHRSMHGSASRATKMYEDAREKVAKFINARARESIAFTRNATEGINLIANSYALKHVETVIISSLEHHSNIVPWQLIGKRIKVIKTKEDLSVDLVHYETLLQQNPGALVAITHVSNAFGIMHPIELMTSFAHQYGCKVLVDAAQSGPHFALDVQKSVVDFLVLSGHKLYGPSGIGALYVKSELHHELIPYQGGGGMITDVEFDRSEFLPYPHGFEAGTPNIGGAIGLGAAVEFIQDIGFQNLYKHERRLIELTMKGLKERDDVIFYTTRLDSGNISFNIKDIHASDIGILLDKQKVQVRTGHHCAQPAMKMLGIEGTVRVSFGVYNDEVDVERFLKALDRAVEILRG